MLPYSMKVFFVETKSAVAALCVWFDSRFSFKYYFAKICCESCKKNCFLCSPSNQSPWFVFEWSSYIMDFVPVSFLPAPEVRDASNWVLLCSTYLFINYFAFPFLFLSMLMKVYNQTSTVDDSVILQDNLNQLVTCCQRYMLHVKTNKCYILSYARKAWPLIFS